MKPGNSIFDSGPSESEPQHFLLALLSDEAILSSRILTSLHVDCKKLRQILLRKLGISQSQLRRVTKKARNSKENQKRRPWTSLVAHDLRWLLKT